MAKYTINYSCGHTGELQLYGKYKDRENKIEWLEREGLCPECYQQMLYDSYTECHKETLLYRDYKNKYPECKVVKDSYNPDDKTIVVFVPNYPKEKHSVLPSEYRFIGGNKLKEFEGYVVESRGLQFLFCSDTYRWDVYEIRSGIPVYYCDNKDFTSVLKAFEEDMSSVHHADGKSYYDQMLNEVNFKELERRKKEKLAKK